MGRLGLRPVLMCTLRIRALIVSLTSHCSLVMRSSLPLEPHQSGRCHSRGDAVAYPATPPAHLFSHDPKCWGAWLGCA